MRATLIRSLAGLGAAAATVAPGTAPAQAVSPMQISVRSMSDRFMTSVEVANPYPGDRLFEIVAYGEDGRQAPIWISAPRFYLAPGARRRVLVGGTFGDAAEMRVLICAETIAAESATARIHGQVCARVSARRYPSPF